MPKQNLFLFHYCKSRNAFHLLFTLGFHIYSLRCYLYTKVLITEGVSFFFSFNYIGLPIVSCFCAFNYSVNNSCNIICNFLMSQNHFGFNQYLKWILTLLCKEIVGSCLQDLKERRSRSCINGKIFKMCLLHLKFKL